MGHRRFQLDLPVLLILWVYALRKSAEAQERYCFNPTNATDNYFNQQYLLEKDQIFELGETAIYVINTNCNESLLTMEACFEVNNTLTTSAQIQILSGTIDSINVFNVDFIKSFDVKISNQSCVEREDHIHICCIKFRNIRNHDYIAVAFLQAIKPVLLSEIEVLKCPLTFLIDKRVDRNTCQRKPSPLMRIKGEFHSPYVTLIILPLSIILGSSLILVGVAVCSACIMKCYQNRKQRITNIKRKRNTNSHLESINLKNVESREDTQLHTINIENILENPLLQKVFVPFHSITIREEIGHGAFGSVFRGYYKIITESEETCTEVAIKTVKMKSFSGTFEDSKSFLNECAIMSSLDHPHVLSVIGICLDPSNSPILLLPFMKNGDLRTYLRNRRDINMSDITFYPIGLSYEVLLRICLEIAQGMKYLSSKKIVHRDLAARNCMIDSKLHVRVADFGLSRDIYESDYYRQKKHERLPVKWMALESLYDAISTEKSDVWSYGITCWEIFSLGRTPYPLVDNSNLLQYLEQGQRLQKPPLCSEAMYALMKRCWHHYAPSRPDFVQLCQLLNFGSPDDCDIKKAGDKQEMPYLDIIPASCDDIKKDTLTIGTPKFETS